MLRRLSLLLFILGPGCQAHPKAAAPPPVATARAAAPSLRLGDAVRPVRYAVRLRLVPSDDSFSGTVDIDLDLRERTSLVWLNGTGLTVDDASLSSGGTAIPARAESSGEDFLGFNLARPVGPGAAQLHVRYHGLVSKREDNGLFRQQEGADWYLISQFESHYARRAFPCFDEPSFKVPWQLTLEVPKQERAFTNTQVASEREEGAFKVVTFEPTKPLPSYLVALGVGPFEIVDAGRAGRHETPIRILAPRGRAAEARYAAKVSGTLLERLELYFGIPYPFEKLDVLTIPLTVSFGAMENPGLVTAAQRIVVAKPEDESINFERGYAGTMAHEFAHLWFGDFVTTAWWDDIWLNEAFATWMATKIIDQWKPEWTHHTGVVGSRGAAMVSDRLVSARKIRQPILSNHDIINAFDGITYQKGAAVLAMFENWVGEAQFQRGIHRYLERHAYGNATAAEFLADVSAEANKDIAPAFSTFLEQAGTPLITVQLDCPSGGRPRLELAQERYLPVGSTGSREQTWKVPICAAFGVGKTAARACTLLETARGELELASARRCPDWVLANHGELGYYRVLYGGDLLNRLLADGGRKLALPERVGLLNDVVALVSSGKLLYGTVLPLVAGLAADPNREIVQAAVSLVGGLQSNLVSDDLRPNYARFVRKAFGKRAARLGWTPRPGDDEDTRLLRPAVLSLVANQGEDQSLQAEATRLALRWIEDRRAVDADVIGAVLGVAARNGNRALFERMRAAARKARDRIDRQRLLAAMGSFRDPELANQARALLLSDEFDVREAMGLIFTGTSRRELREPAYQFVKQHFDELAARFPRERTTMMISLSGMFCDQQHRADAEAFWKERANKMPGGPRTLATTLESIALCSALYQVQEPSVVAFLKKN